MTTHQRLPPGTDPLVALIRAVARLRRADDENRRACQAGEQPRLNRAGTDYAVAKFKLFQVAAAIVAERKANPPIEITQLADGERPFP